jgi:hypothetical protein
MSGLPSRFRRRSHVVGDVWRQDRRPDMQVTAELRQRLVWDGEQQHRDGNLALVGAPAQPLAVSAFGLIMGRRSLSGSNIGGIAETQEMLDFCAAQNITADIEVIPADEPGVRPAAAVRREVPLRRRHGVTRHGLSLWDIWNGTVRQCLASTGGGAQASGTVPANSGDPGGGAGP